jgi:hypothetical protein
VASALAVIGAFFVLVVGSLLIIWAAAVVVRRMNRAEKSRIMPPIPMGANATNRQLARFHRESERYFRKVGRHEDAEWHKSLASGYEGIGD